MIFCAVISAGVDPEGTEERFLFSTISFHTGPGGSPANTPAYDRLLQPANFERSIASGKLIFGITETGFGECVIANADGAFDALTTYAVDGRDFYLWASDDHVTDGGHEGFPSSGGWAQIFRCTMQSIVGDSDVLRVRLRERFFTLNEKACPIFLGTGGTEGSASMAGQPKPMVWGAVYNATPVQLSSSDLTYVVSATGDVAGNHLKDSGSVVARMLTSGAQENDAAANFAALQALPIPIGHYATHATSGTLKLGSPPVGQVTVDASSTASDRPSDVIKAILNSAGIVTSGVSSEINQFSFDALAAWETTADSHVGAYVRDSMTTYGQVISGIVASIGAWFGHTRYGEIYVAVVTEPADMTPMFSFTDDDVISIKRVVSGDPGRGVPYGTITQKFPRNWTPQSGAMAGVVPAKVRSEVAEQFPFAVITVCEQMSSSPPSTIPVTDQFIKAPDYLVESYGAGRRVTSTGAIDATSPAPGAQFAALLGVPREWIEVVIPFRISEFLDLEIGGCVSITHRRFGLTSGKQFMVTSLKYQLSRAPTATLTLWG